MILVTGGSGFIGRHVLRVLAARGLPARALVHRTPVPGVDTVQGDLAEPGTLKGACEGVRTVLHLACHLGQDAEGCDAINGRGTEALIAAAPGARFVYTSNTAVYGDAVHDGATEEQAAVAPVTPISRSRVAAERAVLAVSGLVVRPTFVYGEGDTRFVPAVARAARARIQVDGGRARLSVIAADDLAAAIVDLALSDAPGGVYHANDAQPVRYRDIALALAQHLGTPAPRISLPFPVAEWLVRAVPRLVNSPKWTESARHRLFLVSRDHAYDSSRLWQAVAGPPARSFLDRGAELAGWYGRG